MDQLLFEVAVAAIIDTAKKAYYEGYNQCEYDYQSRWNPKDVNRAWEMSDCKEAIDKMINSLVEKNDGL